MMEVKNERSEVEVTELFAPQAGKRPVNFIVLKYFLLGMLISNGIESILIVPKTLTMMDENEEQLQRIDEIEQEHDEFKLELQRIDRMVESIQNREHHELKEIETKEPSNAREQGKEAHRKVHKVKKAKSPDHKRRGETKEEEESNVDTNRVVEVLLLMYGVITLGIGLFSVFKEHAKLLMVFIAVVALGLVVLFFSGLTLIVFMAILNDIIIALISFTYLQMLNAPCDDYYNTVPQQPVYPDGSYNVDLSQPSDYNVNQ